MLWVAPSEKDTTTATLEKRLWDSADQFCANSGPIFGLIFLRFAEVRFTAQIGFIANVVRLYRGEQLDFTLGGDEAVSDEDFKEQLETLNEELETPNVQARDLEHTIASNVVEILEA